MPYLVTSKGFLKHKIITFVTDENNVRTSHKVEFVWTDKLREAKQFKSRGKVVQYLKVNDLKGFPYNPFEHENLPNKYELVRVNDTISGWEREEKKTLNYWVVRKVLMLYKTDAAFLNGDDKSKYLSYGDAMEEMVKRNIELKYKALFDLDDMQTVNNQNSTNENLVTI